MTANNFLMNILFSIVQKLLKYTLNLTLIVFFCMTLFKIGQFYKKVFLERNYGMLFLIVNKKSEKIWKMKYVGSFC